MEKKGKTDRRTTIGTRLYFIVPGLLLIAFSIVAAFRGVWWIPWFSQRLGRVGITPSPMFGGLGIVFLAIGLFPWNRLAKNQKPPRR
jgi:hypothetical protein